MDFDKFGKTIQRAARDLLDDPSGPVIRPMRRGDLDEVLRLIRLHDSDDYQSARSAFSPERFALPEDVTAHFVIEDPEERRVVGVSGYFIDDDEAQGIYWLGWTYVNPFFRGKGIGKFLMRHVEQHVLALRARKLYLSTSSLDKYQAAVGFYKKCGFIQEAALHDYFRPGEHKLILAKSLSREALTPRPTYTHRPTPAPTSTPKATPPTPSRAPRRDEDDEPTVFEF